MVVDERGEVVEGVVVGKDGDFKGMKGEDELMVGVWLSAWALGHGW